MADDHDVTALWSRVVQFAAHLAKRLELDRIAIVGEEFHSLPTTCGVAVDIAEPTRAEELGPSSLPVFVAPWDCDVKPSSTGRPLSTLDPRHRVAVVVDPRSGGPSDDVLTNLRRGLKADALHAPFAGSLSSRSASGAIALIEDRNRPLSPTGEVPEEFSVIAFMVVYNEADILAASIEHLRRQGVDTYVIDNWSSDGTYELAQSLMGRGVVGLERNPADGPPAYYDWRTLLLRVEKLASELDADWFILNDADEWRQGPWEGVPLREALHMVDLAGYTRIDFTVLNFPPVDNGFEPGSDPRAYFVAFDWGRRPGHFVQEKAWKNPGREVSVAASAGHRVTFEGARVFPYKFLVRHYPIRSQEHGERKIFQERIPRLLPAARQRGWHRHYDLHPPGGSFLSDPEELMLYGDDFHSRYFIERLSGVGIELTEPPRP